MKHSLTHHVTDLKFNVTFTDTNTIKPPFSGHQFFKDISHKEGWGGGPVKWQIYVNETRYRILVAVTYLRMNIPIPILFPFLQLEWESESDSVQREKFTITLRYNVVI